MRHLLLASVLFAILVSSNAASIVLNGALTRNGLDEFGGDDLDAGNVVRVGFFDVSDSEIIANKDNLVYLATHFREFDSSTIGTGVNNIHGHLLGTLTNNNRADVTFLTGKQVYVWALSSADICSKAQALATIQEHAIFYVPFALDSDWAFPDDLTFGRTASFRDLTVGGNGDVLSPDAHLLIGTFGPGTSDASGKPNITLQLVPEPTSSSLLLGLTGLAGFVRRRR